MGNNRKALRVHAYRQVPKHGGMVETECGTIGRTIDRDGGEGAYRTALGNPFRIGTGEAVTCPACRRWLKVKK